MNNVENLSMKIKMLEATCTLIKCPTTGRILLTVKGDDKACCGCGQQTHRVAECEQATPREFLDQQERDSDG